MNATPGKTQEPGIGGPVDLAEIERFRKIRVGVIFVFLAVMIGVVVANAEGWLDWPDDFHLRGAFPLHLMAINVFAWAMLALSVRAGNRTELWLVFLTVPLATGGGLVTTLSIASSLLALDEVTAPLGRLTIVPFLAGLMMALSPVMPGMIQGNRRYKRLVRAAET